MSFERADYLDTIMDAIRELAITPNNYKVYEDRGTTITLPRSSVNSWTIRIYPWDVYKALHLKWYKRIYRRLFPIRSYVKWRVKQYFIRILTAKLVKQVDKFLAWGDEMP